MKIKIIMMLIMSMLLFISAHFILVLLQSKTYIVGISEVETLYFGFAIAGFFVDFILYIAVGLQLLSIYLLLKEVK